MEIMDASIVGLITSAVCIFIRALFIWLDHHHKIFWICAFLLSQDDIPDFFKARGLKVRGIW